LLTAGRHMPLGRNRFIDRFSSSQKNFSDPLNGWPLGSLPLLAAIRLPPIVN